MLWSQPSSLCRRGDTEQRPYFSGDVTESHGLGLEVCHEKIVARNKACGKRGDHFQLGSGRMVSE